MSNGPAAGVILEKLRDDGDDTTSSIAARRLSSHSDRPASLLPTSRQETTPAVSSPRSQNLAFLDGLRGIASLMVYFQHHITEYYGSDCEILHAWGYLGHHHFAQLPFVRPFFGGGAPAVMIFFVLSGYVLSRGALRMLHRGESPGQYLLTAFLRRPLRLWLPPIMVSFPVVFLLQTPAVPLNSHVAVEKTLAAELGYYLWNLVQTVNPFIPHGPWVQWFKYDPPVWTMAYEMNGSVLVYVTVAIAGRFFKASGRLIAFVVTLLLCFEFGHFSTVCFMMGMILAHNDIEAVDVPYLNRISAEKRPWLFNAIFVLGWYMLSAIGPNVKTGTPWFGLPPVLIPYFYYSAPYMFQNTVGAMLVVYASLRLPWLQNLLGRCKWLGRVSFALYLTHVPVLWFVGMRVNRFFGQPVVFLDEPSVFDSILPIPDYGPQGMTTRYLASQIVVLPLTLAVSELATTYVDETSIRVSKVFATKVRQRLGI